MTLPEKWGVFGLLPAWIGIFIISLMYANAGLLKEFDPHQRIQMASMTVAFEKELAALVRTETGQDTKNLVLHLGTTKHCFCELLASQHIAQTADFATNRDLQYRELMLDEHKNLLAFIRSVPALAVFDAQGELAYLGPYSTGLGCLTNISYSEQYLQAPPLHGPVIITETQGCYCEVQEHI